jgi:hypothetical protein
MKKVDVMLKEYVTKLALDDLKYLSGRFNQRTGADLAEAIDALSTCADIDKWLLSAQSCDEFYDMIDTAQEYVDRELGKRVPDLVEA